MKSRTLKYITALTLLSSLAIPVRLAGQANAQGLKYSVLYTFTGATDGAAPFTGQGLIQDPAGNLYGTTPYAGDLSACVSGSETGCGVVYMVDPSGKESVLYSFTGGADGANPVGDLVRDQQGNLYGTTNFGGDLSACGGSGCGVVFKVDPADKQTVLYTFTGGTDGAFPQAGLIQDAEGNLYGTTVNGGASGRGVVFKLDSTGNETVLYSFTGGADGAAPFASLVRDAEGNLYGTTNGGGNLSSCVPGFGCGVVFKVDPTDKETVLYTFTGSADGGSPVAGLVRDEAGNLYGTTLSGGLSGCSGSSCGVVFKVDPTGKETVLYTFTGGADGGESYGGVVRDQQGNLYGTTIVGGNLSCFGFGCGVVFKLSPTGKETVLYAFTAGADGGAPFAGLLRDKNGNLYGATDIGGDLGSPQGWCNGLGCGVVFKISVCHTALCQGGGSPENNDEGAISTN